MAKWRHYEVDCGVVRGPHERRELMLMVAGLKPCALMTDKKAPKELVEFLGLVYRPIRVGGAPRTDYVIVGLPSERSRIEKLAREFVGTKRRHARIGILLGYPREAIRFFCEESKRWSKAA